MMNKILRNSNDVLAVAAGHRTPFSIASQAGVLSPNLRHLKKLSSSARGALGHHLPSPFLVLITQALENTLFPS